MTFDQSVDQMKRDIKAERFFDSLAAQPKPFVYQRAGFDWDMLSYLAAGIVIYAMLS